MSDGCAPATKACGDGLSTVALLGAAAAGGGMGGANATADLDAAAIRTPDPTT